MEDGIDDGKSQQRGIREYKVNDGAALIDDVRVFYVWNKQIFCAGIKGNVSVFYA